MPNANSMGFCSQWTTSKHSSVCPCCLAASVVMYILVKVHVVVISVALSYCLCVSIYCIHCILLIKTYDHCLISSFLFAVLFCPSVWCMLCFIVYNYYRQVLSLVEVIVL